MFHTTSTFLIGVMSWRTTTNALRKWILDKPNLQCVSNHDYNFFLTNVFLHPPHNSITPNTITNSAFLQCLHILPDLKSVLSFFNKNSFLFHFSPFHIDAFIQMPFEEWCCTPAAHLAPFSSERESTFRNFVARPILHFAAVSLSLSFKHSYIS